MNPPNYRETAEPSVPSTSEKVSNSLSQIRDLSKALALVVGLTVPAGCRDDVVRCHFNQGRYDMQGDLVSYECVCNDMGNDDIKYANWYSWDDASAPESCYADARAIRGVVGPEGPAGQPGADGKDGKDGQDGTCTTCPPDSSQPEPGSTGWEICAAADQPANPSDGDSYIPYAKKWMTAPQSSNFVCKTMGTSTFSDNYNGKAKFWLARQLGTACGGVVNIEAGPYMPGAAVSAVKEVPFEDVDGKIAIDFNGAPGPCAVAFGANDYAKVWVTGYSGSTMSLQIPSEAAYSDLLGVQQLAPRLIPRPDAVLQNINYIKL
jgi:hypothetical protein